MRFPTTALLCAGLWLGLVRCGAIVRGIEILYFYNAYRLDVEISAALAKEQGKDPDRSWVIAKQAFNTASDFPGGKLDESKLGANFHGFASATASMGYAKAEGLTKVKDPWNPTWQEVKDIVSWKPIPKGSQYSYGGFDAKTMLGDLAEGQPNSVPNESGKPKTRKNHFFDFDNMLAIVGKRCSDLHALKPEIGKPFMERMAQLSELASEGRVVESAGYKVDNVKNALSETNKKYNKNNPKSITGAVETTEKSSTNFGKFQQLHVRKTKEKIAKVAGSAGTADLQAELSRVADAYKAAESAKTVDDIKKVTGLDAQTKDHIRVHVQEKVLAKSITKQLGGTAPDACGFPPISSVQRRFEL